MTQGPPETVADNSFCKKQNDKFFTSDIGLETMGQGMESKKLEYWRIPRDSYLLFSVILGGASSVILILPNEQQIL